MSGGHFDYSQYRIGAIADEIQSVIDENNIAEYSAKTIAEFKDAVIFLRRAEIYAQRIDWLLSGDDGEETFHERLKEDLSKL